MKALKKLSKFRKLAKRTAYTILHCTILDFIVQGPVHGIEAGLKLFATSPAASGVLATAIVFLVGLIHFEEHLTS